MTYTVALVDSHIASRDAIYAAEARFRNALNDALGVQVGRCLNAFIRQNEVGAANLAREQIKDVSRWSDAFNKATIAGYLRMGALREAYFKVRLS